jgi:hypothetical protein
MNRQKLSSTRELELVQIKLSTRRLHSFKLHMFFRVDKLSTLTLQIAIGVGEKEKGTSQVWKSPTR